MCSLRYLCQRSSASRWPLLLALHVACRLAPACSSACAVPAPPAGAGPLCSPAARAGSAWLALVPAAWRQLAQPPSLCSASPSSRPPTHPQTRAHTHTHTQRQAPPPYPQTLNPTYLPPRPAGILYEFFPAALRAVLPPGGDPALGLSAGAARSVAAAALTVATLMNAPPGFLEFLLCVPWAELGPLYLQPEREECSGAPAVPQVCPARRAACLAGLQGRPGRCGEGQLRRGPWPCRRDSRARPSGLAALPCHTGLRRCSSLLAEPCPACKSGYCPCNACILVSGPPCAVAPCPFACSDRASTSAPPCPVNASAPAAADQPGRAGSAGERAAGPRFDGLCARLPLQASCKLPLAT